MTQEKDDNNPWRHHPLFMAYSKFHAGKNVVMGRVVALVIAAVILLIIFWFM